MTTELSERFAALNRRSPEEVAAAKAAFKAEFGKPATERNRRYAAAGTDALLCITETLPDDNLSRAKAMHWLKLIQEAAG